MNANSFWRALRLDHGQSMSASAGANRAERNLNLLLALVCAAALGLLAFLGGYRAGFEAFYAVGNRLPVQLVELLSMPGETVIAICLVALIARRKPHAVWMCALASAYASIITQAAKNLFDAARPPAVLGDWVVTSGPALKMFSFPSGHTVTAFLLAASLSVGASRRAKLLAYAAAAVVGSSRVWIGVHWPLDVIAGAGIAALSVGLAIGTTPASNWKLGLKPYLCCVSVIVLCAVAALMNRNGSPVAQLLRVAIGSLSLAVIARDFVVRPWSGAPGALRPEAPPASGG